MGVVVLNEIARRGKLPEFLSIMEELLGCLHVLFSVVFCPHFATNHFLHRGVILYKSLFAFFSLLVSWMLGWRIYVP
jgi:hypothetical protein